MSSHDGSTRALAKRNLGFGWGSFISCAIFKAVRYYGTVSLVCKRNGRLTVEKFRGRTQQRAAALTALAATITLAGAIPAHAEGSRTTKITAWRYGAESRTWGDGNLDGAATRVVFAMNCESDKAGGFSAPIVLYRVRGGLPDVNKGTRINTCNASSWGDVESGTYYFAYEGPYVISVRNIGIYW